MPPKRVRAEDTKEKEDEKDPTGSECPSTEQRRLRAEEKKRAIFESKRELLKAERAKESNESSGASPVRKKGKEEKEKEQADSPGFDPLSILRQAGAPKLVDTDKNGFMPLALEESLSFDSDSFNSMSQLSPGLQLGNLSLNGSSDSPNQAAGIVHAAGEVAEKEKKDGEYADGLDNIIGCAVTFMKRAGRGANRKKKGADSLNAPYSRGKSVIGNSILTNVLSSVEDLALLERTYSAAELVLLSSPFYPLDNVYKKAVATIYKTRSANELVGVQEAMTINQCLAWLARTARCSISSLIPPGEYYPDAENYLSLRLIVPTLPLYGTACKGVSEQDWTMYQLVRCMAMMAVADLRPLLVDDRCILLFAIGMLYIDDAATEEMREAAHSVVRNVLSSCSALSLLLEPLFNLTPLIVRRPDEAFKWMLMFKSCGGSSPELLLSIGASLFVFVCERAECTPDSFHLPTPSATFTSYINVLSETMIDVFAVYNVLSHRRYHRSLVSILNCCLSPSALQGCEEGSKRALLKCIEAVRNRLNPDLADDSIVITELRTLSRRVETVRRGMGGRRNSEEVLRIHEERRKMKEEKREQQREDQMEKEHLKKQRENAQVSASNSVTGNEEMEEGKEEEASSERTEGDEERRERERMEEVEDEDEDEEEEEEEDEEEEEEEEEDGEEKSSASEFSSIGGEKSEIDVKKEDNERKAGGGEQAGAVTFADAVADFVVLEDEATRQGGDLPDTVPDSMNELDSQNWLPHD